MADYYVDLDASVVGGRGAQGLYHEGNKADPFSWEQFRAHAAANTGDTYYLRGSRDDSSTTSEWLILGSTFLAWDLEEYGPWRLKIYDLNQSFSGTHVMRDGVIEISYEASYRGEHRRMYHSYTGSNNEFFIGVGFYDCTVVGAGISPMYIMQTTNAFNTVFSHVQPLSIWSTATFTVDSECVSNKASGSGNFYSGSGTFIDNGMSYNVSLSAAPTYTSTDLTSFALGATAGVGTSGVWADTPTTFYVDLSENSTGNPGHYGDAPMGFSELKPFLEASTQDGDIYKLKGEHQVTGSSYSLAPAGSGVTISMVAWDQKKHGPWRLEASGSYDLTFGDSGKNINIEGAVLYAGDDINLQGDDTYIRTSFLKASDLIRIVGYTNGITTEISGCTLIADVCLIIDTSISSYQINIRDSVLDIPYVRGATGGTTQATVSLTHTLGSASSVSVFNANSGVEPAIGGITESTTEWGWTPPSWPNYDGRRYLFYYSKVLDGSSISGSGSYTNYSTGLWGDSRTHIGAVAFERVLYFDIDTDNDSSRSDGIASDEPANYYELLTQVKEDQGLVCKVRGARDSENRHKDVFAYLRPDLWEYNFVSESTQYYVYNEYDLDPENRTLDYSSPNADTFMRSGLGGEFDIIMDVDLNGTTNTLGFSINDPNIVPASLYPYVEVTIDGTNANAVYVDSTPTTTTTTSALTADRALLRLRRVVSGSDYTYYFEYHENLRATYETSGWTEIWSTTLTTSQLSDSNLTLYLERGSLGTSFHGIEIKAAEGLEVPVAFITQGNEFVGNVIEAWDLDNYGPWRLYAYQICGNFTSFNDCILEATSNDSSYPSHFCGSTLSEIMHTNVNIKVGNAGMSVSSEGDIHPKGVTLISGDSIELDDSRPNYLTESQTLNRSLFDDFNSDTWDPFWNTDVQTYYRLDPDSSRIEAKSDAVNEVYFLTLSDSIDWIYECQMFVRDSINKSHGFRIDLNNGDNFSFKWYNDELFAEGSGMTKRDIVLNNDALTVLQIKLTYVASTREMTWFFRFTPLGSWVQLAQVTLSAAATSIDLGFDVGYSSSLDQGNGFDWVYLQESGTTLSNEGFPFEMDFTDSALNASSFVEGSLSATKINSNYTAFTSASAPAKGTHTNVKTSWSAPSQPSWDTGYIDSTTTPTPDAWSYLTLRGDISAIFGSGSYSEYPTGLFGYERYGVGAYYFPENALEFTASPNPGYTNENITFTPVNDDTATGWRWDFESDGTIDSTSRIGNKAYNFDSIFDQYYIATLSILGSLPQTATGIIGVRNRLDFSLDVDPQYVIGFPAAETIDFGVTGTTRPLNPSSFEWTIERNLSSYTAINGVTGVSLAFTDGGSYTVELRAADYGVSGMAGNIQQNTSSALFEVLSVSISVNPNKVQVGDTVTCQVTGNDVSGHTFRWRFGDSTYADGSSVTHQYSSGGVYSLELIVDRGTVNEKTLNYDPLKANYDELQVQVSDLSVDFTVDNEDGYPPLTGAFSDASDSSLGLTGWEWFFTGPPGTPHITGETGPIYIYDAEGIYFPYLRVTDLGGFQGIATGMIEVFSSSLDIKVYRGSTLLPEPVTVELPVTLTFEPVVDDEPSITSWKWELIYDDMVHGEIILSDQQSVTKLNFNHTFTAPASYKIRLTVTDTFSNVFTATETFTITENIEIFANPTSGFYPLNVDFSISNAASSDPIRIDNEWDFTDDGVYDAATPTASYTYTAVNTYTCRLRIAWELVDKYASSKTAEISLEKTEAISVTYPAFTLDLSVNPTRGRKPLSVIIRGISNNPVSTWNWSVDGVALPQTTQQVSYTFNQEGVHVVTLTASDTFGQGPLTLNQIVQVSAELSTFDESVNPSDPESILELEGSADVSSPGVGARFRIPGNTPSVQPSGFKAENGITIIFD